MTKGEGSNGVTSGNGPERTDYRYIEGSTGGMKSKQGEFRIQNIRNIEYLTGRGDIENTFQTLGKVHDVSEVLSQDRLVKNPVQRLGLIRHRW